MKASRRRDGARRLWLARTAGVLASVAIARWTPAAAAPDGARPLLVLGDSLSAEYGLRRGSGWVGLLEERLRAQDRALPVVNASISGETTSGGLARLPELLRRHRPGLVLIELGANDALRGLPMEAMEANLRRMVRLSREAGARVVIAGMKMPPNYGRRYAEAFEAAYARVAGTERVPLAPFFLEGVAEREDWFQADRIHPNERAQARMLDNVWPALKPLL